MFSLKVHSAVLSAVRSRSKSPREGREGCVCVPRDFEFCLVITESLKGFEQEDEMITFGS